MSSARKLAIVTEKQFLSLSVSKEHVELIDGEVFVSPSPSVFHQYLVGRLHYLLMQWANGHPPAWVGLSPLDVRIAPLRIVQPDLSLFLRGMPKGEGPIHVVPNLVVEVLSQNRSHDTVTKKLLYAQAGVGEYWLVDEVTKSIEVFGGLELLKKSRTQATSVIAGGFAVDVKKLFQAQLGPR